MSGELDTLVLESLAEHMGCTRVELGTRGRALKLEEREAKERRRKQEQADAQAALERGEINDVSEYIPF